MNLRVQHVLLHLGDHADRLEGLVAHLLVLLSKTEVHGAFLCCSVGVIGGRESTRAAAYKMSIWQLANLTAAARLAPGGAAEAVRSMNNGSGCNSSYAQAMGTRFFFINLLTGRAIVL